MKKIRPFSRSFHVIPVLSKASLTGIMLCAFCILYGQQRLPLPILTSEMEEQDSIQDNINYDVKPNIALEALETHNQDNVSRKAGYARAAHAEKIFEIGKKTDFVGCRTTLIDKGGSVMLMEDTIEPLLYLRFQKLLSSEVEVRVYAENGKLLYNTVQRNLPFGMEIELNHSTWPEGTHKINIKLDGGKTLQKYIQKKSRIASK